MKNKMIEIKGQGIKKEFDSIEDAGAWLSGYAVGKEAKKAVDDNIEVKNNEDALCIRVKSTGLEVCFGGFSELTKWVEGYKEGAAGKVKRGRRKSTPRKPRAKKTEEVKPAARKLVSKKAKKKTTKKKAPKTTFAPVTKPVIPAE